MAWNWDKLQKQKMSRGGSPPQMDEIFSKFKDIKGKFPGLWIIIALAIIFLILYSSLYTIGVSEVGVVEIQQICENNLSRTKLQTPMGNRKRSKGTGERNQERRIRSEDYKGSGQESVCQVFRLP